MTFAATGRLPAHTKCRDGLEDFKRSVEFCGRAVADNENEAGNHSKQSLFHWDGMQATESGPKPIYEAKYQSILTGTPLVNKYLGGS